ncbi:ORF1338 [White spot syndrome virus]|uniref:Wsv439 n=3 Tax=White spot syndrome virus TaxID=342409 RepID=Q8VAH5_WSSVS|nr:wsv439 [Shrimp white spot syndrome virus]AFX59816.1 wsv439 [White spot syndrome virus]AAL33440.1 wsv439 [Shrimp white spot syndrome virus]AAL89367.1 WSSV499 [Shrimp white spot syndrome virus]ATU83885.1 ORF1338 [White spot syndrome virus]AWQ60563.1 wsv439 [Shrimp white spot syndrome virus]
MAASSRINCSSTLCNSGSSKRRFFFGFFRSHTLLIRAAITDCLSWWRNLSRASSSSTISYLLYLTMLSSSSNVSTAS